MLEQCSAGTVCITSPKTAAIRQLWRSTLWHNEPLERSLPEASPFCTSKSSSTAVKMEQCSRPGCMEKLCAGHVPSALVTTAALQYTVEVAASRAAAATLQQPLHTTKLSWHRQLVPTTSRRITERTLSLNQPAVTGSRHHNHRPQPTADIVTVCSSIAKARVVLIRCPFSQHTRRSTRKH
jgi:hypothetical protein